MTHEHVLLIGDTDRQMYSTVSQALPTAQIKSVPSLFDGIAELSHEHFTTVLAAVEPMERRPEAAMRTLRELSGEGRLLLFGHPTLEPLSQKMMEFGCDDYLVTPITPGELLETLGSPALRLRKNGESTAAAPTPAAQPAVPDSPLGRVQMVNVILDALLHSPQDPVGIILAQINAALPANMKLFLTAPDAALPAPTEGMTIVSRRPADAPNANGSVDLPPLAKTLHLSGPADHDRLTMELFLSELATHLSKVQALQQRNVGLQRLAITDDLTGLANGRYFRQFLAKIIDTAKSKRFPVTLFLFDIDNFKRYNDQYGHGVGDEILQQTAALMKRCVRDHDLVARISGDEFAVIFWEKEGPRTPREPHAAPSGRTPQEPQGILDRFRRLLSTQDFPGLGPGGKGCLTISGGLAVYPYDAQDMHKLIEAADTQLMFGAKRSGRNSIHLVGGDCLPLGNGEPESESHDPQ
jgi:GGDEF domain-containing protein